MRPASFIPVDVDESFVNFLVYLVIYSVILVTCKLKSLGDLEHMGVNRNTARLVQAKQSNTVCYFVTDAHQLSKLLATGFEILVSEIEKIFFCSLFLNHACAFNYVGCSVSKSKGPELGVCCFLKHLCNRRKTENIVFRAFYFIAKIFA